MLAWVLYSIWLSELHLTQAFLQSMSNKILNHDNCSRFYFNVASRCAMARCYLTVAFATTLFYYVA